jgi:hypothetical protein
MSRGFHRNRIKFSLVMLDQQCYIAVMPFKSGKKNSYIASRGGRKGGPARAASMTPERRKEIAIKAASTRWERVRVARAPETSGSQQEIFTEQ